MSNVMTCPICGAPDQEVDKYCEHCGTKVQKADNSPAPDAVAPDAVAPSAAVAPSVPAASASSANDITGHPIMRFVQQENGVLKPQNSFEVPVGSRLLVGRTDPRSGIFPEVDVSAWSKRVSTPEGELYTIHRKQCYISRDQTGRLWIVDHPSYLGDTLVAPAGTSHYSPIPTLVKDRDSNEEEAVALDVGDRILMGQGRGILVFQLVEG